MPIQVTCHHCRKRLNAPDKMAGARVKCPNCRAVIEIPRPNEPEPSLVDLLEEVTAAPPAAAMPKSTGGPSFSAPARPKARSTPAWKQGASAGFLKDNVWTIVMLLSGIPFVVFFGHILIYIPWLIGAAIVFISERGRQTHGSQSGLNPVDRIIFGIIVGLNLVICALVGIIGVIKGAQQPNAAHAMGFAVGTALGLVIGNIPSWLISYFLARAFGLGRTYAFLGLLGGLGGVVMLMAFPGGVAGEKWQMAMKAGADANAAKQAVAGGAANPQLPGGPQNGPPFGQPPGQQAPPNANPQHWGEPAQLKPLANAGQPNPGQANPGQGNVAQAKPDQERLKKRIPQGFGDGLAAHVDLKQLDFRDRLKHAFAWDKASTRDLLAARLITSDDQDRVSQALRRTSALERPMMNVYFMLGMTGLDKPTRNKAEWMEQKGAEGEYRHASGDAGMLLLDGLMSRVERGSFGDWGCDVQPPQESDPRAVLFSIADSEDFLRAFARQQNVDVLIALNLTGKVTGNKKKKNLIITLVARVIDVASDTELWASKPITNTAIAAGRAKGSDPSVQMMNDLLEYLDQNLTLEPLPSATAADAIKEAERLVADKTGDKLLKLATLRVYQCQELLTADQAVAYASKILDRDGAKDFVSDEPLERLNAIDGLVPQR